MNYQDYLKRITYLDEIRKKYGVLTALDEQQKNVLKKILKEFNEKNILEYKCTLLIDDEIKELDFILKESNINFSNILDKDTVESIIVNIDNEVNKLRELENMLNVIVNPNYLFDIDYIKNKIKKGIIVDFDELNKIINKFNKGEIDSLIDILSIYNNNSIKDNRMERNIVYQAKLIIHNIENNINFICYKLNINYNNKTIKEKYYEILEKIENKINKYATLKKECNKIYGVFEYVENSFSDVLKSNKVDLNFCFEEIKELSGKDIDLLIEDILLYESANKRLTKENVKVIKG